MKIISFTFFFTFLNKTTFKDKTHMILVQGICHNLKQIKNGKKMELATLFRERKDVLCCLQETQRKTEKDASLHCGFYTKERILFCLSDHDKSKLQVQTINEGKCT